MWRLTRIGIGLEIEYFLLIFSSGLVDSDRHGGGYEDKDVTGDGCQVSTLNVPLSPHSLFVQDQILGRHPSHTSPLGYT